MDGYRLALLTALGGFVVLAQMHGELQRRRRSEERIRAVLADMDRRVGERTSELSSANDLKDRFLSTISHELRTPLNAIIGWAHVLKTGVVKPSEITHAIEAIDRNAHAQARLVNELLDISRMMQGRLVLSRQPVEFQKLIDEEVAQMRPSFEARGLTLHEDRRSAPLHVLGDEARLRQVVQHLLSNAIKFTSQGGRITVRLAAEGPFAELSVRDNGVGLDPDALPHVFAPFYQGRPAGLRSGMGVGLAIVGELVQLHGGSVSAESEGVGRGATFTVKLPLTKASPRQGQG